MLHLKPINPIIKLSAPSFGQSEVDSLIDVLTSGWVAGQGSKNWELVETVSEYIEVNKLKNSRGKHDTSFETIFW